MAMTFMVGIVQKVLIDECWSFDILRSFESFCFKNLFHHFLQTAAKDVLLKSLTIYCAYNVE